ncbi:LuxR family transcriptional regulator [Mucilaginibacter terrigena]|uniref:LuxR family transcriptional regulator n=1 Tax=Mucilaginibacter terrigena TaxID=2492395 RepID=A0A4V1ZCD6_9SPHI|nr:AAA family ATPase [Mucilaginibacter terrigena]RYU92290.1 LuxR family transcriptional regulator [Mucilaginibacter terrigena]
MDEPDFYQISPTRRLYRPAAIEAIRTQLYENKKRLKKHGLDESIYLDPQKTNLLFVKTAGEWMKQEYGKPMPRMLLGDLWLEGEMCILFADTNLGKSILAVQIGNNLAQGCCTGNFNNQLEAQTPVLYVDFEMGSKQFESRYYDSQWGSHQFGHTFYRAEFNPEAENPALYDSYDAYLESALDSAIDKTKAKVLIIDNLTYMATGTERAREALPLMKRLKALKKKHNISMLVLAHTPKRMANKPITVNDLQGSKMIINFCDSAFAIGKSHTRPGKLYLKQVKQRSRKTMYDEHNVCLCHIQKEYTDLHFAFEGYAKEHDHLQSAHAQARQQLQQQARDLHQTGQSYRQISAQLKVPVSTLGRWLG